MKVSDKTILFSCNYFKEELKEFYNKVELQEMLSITFLHYLKLSRIDLILKSEDQISQSDFHKITNVVERLKKYEPLAQIIGEWEFYGISFKINEHVLIPRPETEELVQLIVNEHKDKEQLSILDIGTGSGCIAIALKKEIPNANLFAYDVSKEALKIAAFNAKKNKLNVTFSEVDILEWESHNENEKYDVIVSNPPYITYKEKELMHGNVLDYEPHLALFVDNQEPLLFYNVISEFALSHLTENGKLYFEINEKYGGEVLELLKHKQFRDIEIIKDINGKDRIVKCHLK